MNQAKQFTRGMVFVSVLAAMMLWGGSGRAEESGGQKDVLHQVATMAKVLETPLREELHGDLVGGSIFQPGGVRGFRVPGVGVIFLINVNFPVAEEKPREKGEKGPKSDDLWNRIEKGEVGAGGEVASSDYTGPYSYSTSKQPTTRFGTGRTGGGGGGAYGGTLTLQQPTAGDGREKTKTMERVILETLARYGDRMTAIALEENIIVLVSGGGMGRRIVVAQPPVPPAPPAPAALPTRRAERRSSAAPAPPTVAKAPAAPPVLRSSLAESRQEYDTVVSEMEKGMKEAEAQMKEAAAEMEAAGREMEKVGKEMEGAAMQRGEAQAKSDAEAQKAAEEKIQEIRTKMLAVREKMTEIQREKMAAAQRQMEEARARMAVAERKLKGSIRTFSLGDRDITLERRPEVLIAKTEGGARGTTTWVLKVKKGDLVSDPDQLRKRAEIQAYAAGDSDALPVQAIVERF